MLEKAVSQLLVENQKIKEKNLKLRRSAEENLRTVKFELECEKSKNKKLELLIVETVLRESKAAYTTDRTSAATKCAFFSVKNNEIEGGRNQ